MARVSTWQEHIPDGDPVNQYNHAFPRRPETPAWKVAGEKPISTSIFYSNLKTRHQKGPRWIWRVSYVVPQDVDRFRVEPSQITFGRLVANESE